MDRINWVTCDCFNAIGQLSAVRDREGVHPELVHARMTELLRLLAERASAAGYSEHDTLLVLYALTALTDEVMMASSGAVRDYWATRPLQLSLFGENVAGERFFENLEQIRRQPRQLDVLRTYFVCLLFGFRGRYGVRGAEHAINELIESVRDQVQHALLMPEILSPNGARPEAGRFRAAARRPALWLGGALLAMTCLLYLGLAVALQQQLARFTASSATVTGSDA
jgi:type VI secretion system protein ImpK